MGLFSWLFGKSKGASLTWIRSAKGNMTSDLGDGRWVTVFKHKKGWKFSAPYPDEANSDEPYYSPVVETEKMAQANAEAYIAGEPFPFSRFLD